MRFIGVDPGQSGGIAVIGRDGGCYATKMPATEKDVFDFVESCQCSDGAVAVIEQVSSWPGQGVASSFKFGMGYGGLRMALIAAGIRFESVPPRVWQKAIGITPRRKSPKESKAAFKQRLRARAQELFPGMDVTLATADALLLAEYCRRKFSPLTPGERHE